MLARALDQAGEVLARVQPDQMSAPTPCAGWNVADLIAHLVAAPGKFVVMNGGGEPDWSAERTPPTANAAAEFRAAADELITSWHQAGEAAHVGQADWQTAEIAVHTWDLARATGQPSDLDPEVAERGRAFMSAGLNAENRGPVFAAEVSVPDDAPVYDRLAAVAGRNPWR